MNPQLLPDNDNTHRMMNAAVLEKDIETIVTRIFQSPDLIQYPYHNLDHTLSVVMHTREIAAYYLLNESDTFIATTAAWFHDIGHLYGEMQDHEDRSVLIMQYYLQSVPQEMIAAISSCIMATKYPGHPETLLEKILCDADTYHVGTSFFRQTDGLVEMEMEMRTGKKFPDWHKKSLAFLNRHNFFTEYCRNLLNEGKKRNKIWLESIV